MARQKTILRLFEPQEGEAPQPRRGVFLVPNLITTGALFAAFFSIVAAMDGRFGAAALAIFCAMVLDTLDGRVARLTRTESEFGAHYDSLSDVVAFGVAPALVVFHWALSDLRQLGWIVTFVFVACAALRLARFNTSHDADSFTGLPSPTAAAVVASAVWIWHVSGATPGLVGMFLMAVLVVGVALLMVSNFEYYSPKLITIRDRVPFVVLVGAVVVFAVIFADPPIVLFTLAFAYTLSGPAKYLWKQYGSSARKREKTKGESLTDAD